MIARFSLAAVLCLTTCAAHAQIWTKVKIFVPDDRALQRLLATPIDMSECHNRVGVNDAIIGPNDWLLLAQTGLRYKIVGSAPDPRNWGATYGAGEAADYRNEYFTADQILAFFDGLVAEEPDFVKKVQIGLSINAEPIYAYKFLSPASTRTPNNVILQGLIHAREWISGSCVMHIGRQLLDEMRNPTEQRLTGNKAVWIVPIVNPDGYRYTWTNNRNWRKNRRANAGGSFGVDLNRNYSVGWGLSSGSSGNPSSGTYRGTAPFSEPETSAIDNLASGLDRIGGFLDIHSYGQLILYPWSYTTDPPANLTFVAGVSARIKSAMQQFGMTYTAGQTSTTLYLASGTSKDYAYGEYDSLSWTFEMRDTGQNGFVLPTTQITPTQDEAWAGFKTMIREISG